MSGFGITAMITAGWSTIETFLTCTWLLGRALLLGLHLSLFLLLVWGQGHSSFSLFDSTVTH